MNEAQNCFEECFILDSVDDSRIKCRNKIKINSNEYLVMVDKRKKEQQKVKEMESIN